MIDKPVIIIGCNRSGTTLLFNNLSEHPRTWSLYVESQRQFYKHFPIDPVKGDAVESASPYAIRQIRSAFYYQANNKERFMDGPLRRIPRKLLQRPLTAIYRPFDMRLVEKTPANCFRILLLKELFPDARFLFLIRRPEDTISSLMEGWKIWSKTKGQWAFGKWHYLVPPGWQDYTSRKLEEICAFQWKSANETAWRDLNQHCNGQFMLLRHEDLVREPEKYYREILDFCKLTKSAHFDTLVKAQSDRVFTTRGSKPRPDKWKQLHFNAIESVRNTFTPLAEQFYKPPVSQPFRSSVG